MSTVWNPSDETTNITLSNTNHTATSTAGGNNGVRATGLSHSSGKWYLEYSSILSGGSGGRYGCGKLTDTLGAGGQFGVDPVGFLHGTSGSTTIATPDGKTLGFAIDLTNNLLWATYDGTNWTGDGTAGANPATGTHGLTIAGIGAAVIPMTWLQNNPGHCTLNCGDNAFILTVPSGFTAWDAPALLPPSAQATVFA